MKNQYMLPLNLQLFGEETQTVDAGTEEVAAPQETSIDEGQVNVDENAADESGPEAVEQDKPKQTPEMDAHFAKLRREKEAAEKQLKSMDEWVSKTYGESHNIHTWAEYQAAIEAEKERAYYEEKGVDPDVVEEIVSKKLENHPAIQQAKVAEFNAHIQSQIDQLNKEFPDAKINSTEELFNLPYYAEKLHPLLTKGVSLSDAYFLANKEEIQAKQTQAAQQAALNKVNGKNHIRSTSGDGDVDSFNMPDDVLQNYRSMFSKEYRSGKMTDKDFISHYRKSIGK